MLAGRQGYTPKSPSADPDPDAALLQRLRDGDQTAYAALLQRHGGRLLAVARRLLRNEADARDAVQDALLSAYRGLDRFEGQCRLASWLHRIAVNAALMKLRVRRARVDLPAEDSTIDALQPAFATDGHTVHSASTWSEAVDSRLEREHQRTLVRSCIERLPEGYRIVLVLRDIEELDTEEVASMLGMTAGNVKVRLHRARLALRALLDPHLRMEAAP